MGGMMATRASGTNTVKFGTMRENVLGCKAVLANGEILHTGSKAIKSSAGYDLTHLLCGSEGTLAVITELLIKIHPHPEKIASAICGFPSMKSAVDSASCIIQSAIPVARIELLDEYSISAVNAYSKLSMNECSTLFFEFHGTDSNVKEQVSDVIKLSLNLCCQRLNKWKELFRNLKEQSSNGLSTQKTETSYGKHVMKVESLHEYPFIVSL